MTDSRRAKRPGPAHADRRELGLVRRWLEDDSARGVLEAMLAERSANARAALDALARRAGATRPNWRGFRNGASLIFREEAESEPLALVVDDSGRVRLGPAIEIDPGGEVAVEDLDEALDGVASPVLAWIRSNGGMPRGASRLAALFEPRRRGTAWPSSQS